MAAVLMTSMATSVNATGIWDNLRKQPRGDAELEVDGQACFGQLGLMTRQDSTAYKKCMRARGWKLRRYDEIDASDPTWQSCPFVPGC
mgnify:CR=1 FL=1